MRNRLIHEYDAVDIETIWNTIHMALPDLISVLKAISSTEEA